MYSSFDTDISVHLFNCGEILNAKEMDNQVFSNFFWTNCHFLMELWKKSEKFSIL